MEGFIMRKVLLSLFFALVSFAASQGALGQSSVSLGNGVTGYGASATMCCGNNPTTGQVHFDQVCDPDGSCEGPIEIRVWVSGIYWYEQFDLPNGNEVTVRVNIDTLEAEDVSDSTPADFEVDMGAITYWFEDGNGPAGELVPTFKNHY